VRNNVAVIGCGPTGLAAVHAAYSLGNSVTIYGPMGQSPQRGAILLQKPIPGISNPEPDGYIKQLVTGGTILDYRYKLYGDINIGYSGDQLLPGYHAWDHVYAYNELWRRYITQVPLPEGISHVQAFITPEELAELHKEYHLVVCTAPLPNLCMNKEHQFTSVRIAITMDYSYPDQPPDTSVFSASPDTGWLRSARIFGNDSTEWLPGSAPGNAIIIRKPISHTCNCFPHVLLAGRNGAWNNLTWVDTAYFQTREALISLARTPEWEFIK
jgi:hypothetical protein